jgi:hypothetical protein
MVAWRSALADVRRAGRVAGDGVADLLRGDDPPHRDGFGGAEQHSQRALDERNEHDLGEKETAERGSVLAATAFLLRLPAGVLVDR